MWRLLLAQVLSLDRGELILFMEGLRKAEPHAWDFSTMPDSLRRFFSNETRYEGEHVGPVKSVK